MKFYLFLFVFFISALGTSQTHKVAGGAGTMSFQKFTVDVHYQFNYKLLFAHAGYFHSNGFPKEYYSSLDQFSGILGMQTDEERRFTFHWGLGASYFKPTIKTYLQSKIYAYTQYNPIILFGLNYELLEHHQLEANFYGSQIFFRSKWGTKTHYSGGFCSYLTLCYVYKFGKIVKD